MMQLQGVPGFLCVMKVNVSSAGGHETKVSGESYAVRQHCAQIFRGNPVNLSP